MGFYNGSNKQSVLLWKQAPKQDTVIKILQRREQADLRDTNMTAWFRGAQILWFPTFQLTIIIGDKPIVIMPGTLLPCVFNRLILFASVTHKIAQQTKKQQPSNFQA